MSKLVEQSLSRWFVVRTNPNCEDRAARSLSQSGYGVYVPVMKRERQERRSKKWVEHVRPLMTGYIFVEMPNGPRCFDFFSLRACNGVRAVLGVSDWRGETKPFAVPSRLVERLMAAQLAMMFDDTREAKARRGEQAVGMYRPGAHVLVKDGPFLSLVGEVAEVRANGTVQALVNLFGRMTPVEFDPVQIELAVA